MPRKMIAIEWQDDTEKCIHYFEKPEVSEKGFYRQAVSIGAFKDREAKRRYPSVKIIVNGQEYWTTDNNVDANMRWFSVYDYKEWKRQENFTVESFKRSTIEWKGLEERLPSFSHGDVWDFYNTIGYDYKAKKYV